MKTLLVTGGAGFIGGNFVLDLLAQGGYRIVNLDALTYAGNLDTLAAVKRPARPRVRARRHRRPRTGRCAAARTPARTRSSISRPRATSTARSTDLPRSCRRTSSARSPCSNPRSPTGARSPLDVQDGFRFLHVSTDEVYGSLGPVGRFTEETPYAPNSPYSASKAASDHLVRAFHHTYGLPTLTTNCSNNYGPYQFPEKLIPLMILKALRGEPLPVYGDGRNVRDWLYVRDHCRAIQRVLAIGRVGEVYNVGGDAERENIQVVRAILKRLDERQPLAGGATARRPDHLREGPPRARPPLRDRRDARSGATSAGVRRRRSRRGSRRRSTGTSTTRAGCSACRDGSYRGERLGVATARHDSSRKRHDDQGHHPRRRRRHAAASAHAVDQQAAAAGVRQADDLLPAEHADAGGHPRDPRDQHAARAGAVPATARRRLAVGHRHPLRRAAAAERARQAFIIGREFVGGQAVVPGARRQHLLRPRLHRRAAARAATRTHGATVFGYWVRDPERYGVAEFDADGPGRLASRRSPRSRSRTTRSPASTSTTTRVCDFAAAPEALAARRARDHRPQPHATSRTARCTSRSSAAATRGSTPARTSRCCRRRTSSRRSSSARACACAARRRSRSRNGWIDAEQVLKLAKPLAKSGYGLYLERIARGETLA